MSEDGNIIDFYKEKNDSSYEIHKSLKEFIARSGKTQAAIARELGVSEALLSQFLSRTYKGNVNDMTEKVKEYIASKKFDPAGLTEFKETSTAKGIWYAIRFAHVHGDIAFVYGEAGRGKTEVLKEYARKNDKVIYIQADATISNIKSKGFRNASDH